VATARRNHSLCNTPQSPVVREHASIPGVQVIMKAIAVGFPDPSFPANRVYSNRKSMEEAVTFRGFEGGAKL
jgi:hypothetical protein